MAIIAGETLHVHFLGTAGALPTPQRNPSCLMIRRGSDTLLFDCGEGAQQQMMRVRTGFTVDAIFISHWHADHYLGIFGLLETMGFNGRQDPIRLYGPRRIHEIVSIIRQLNQGLSFPIEAHELSDGEEILFDGYRVIPFTTRHGCESFGFILVEDERPGRLTVKRRYRLESRQVRSLAVFSVEKQLLSTPPGIRQPSPRIRLWDPRDPEGRSSIPGIPAR